MKSWWSDGRTVSSLKQPDHHREHFTTNTIMKVIIRNAQAREVFFNGNFYQTNSEVEIPLKDAMDLSRKVELEFVENIEKKYDPEQWKNKRFVFVGDSDTVSGFGRCTSNLLKYSKDYDIRYVGNRIGISDPDILRMASRAPEQTMGAVWHEQPKDFWEKSPFGKNIAIVPFETTRIPASWVPRINAFDALLVPSVHNMGMMSDSGVTVPIELVQWGVDRTYDVERNNSVFTFGTMGALSIRKGTDILIDAFRKAFPTQTDVKLILKTSFRFYPFTVKDSRIQVMMDAISDEEMMEKFWRKIDCFVFPTRGEGFGLPPLEAMATGLPIITTGWSGEADYLTDKGSFTLDYKLVPAEDFSERIYKEDCGKWAEPSVSDLVEKMRWMYSNAQAAKEMGNANKVHVKRFWLWEDKIKMFHDALNKHF
jgi:glycosyltransferase involved in cell wall biosynthesis